MTDGSQKASLIVVFDDSQWKKLALPPGCNQRELRRSVEHRLWLFNCEKQVPPPHSVDGLRRKVLAAQELLKARDLLSPWAKPAERDKLTKELELIASTSELAIDDLEAEAAAQAKPRGRPVDWALRSLTDDLCRIWRQAGGHVGGGVKDDRTGGPLIRLIRYAVRHVDVEPTAEEVRHWIRGFNDRELRWIELSSGGDN
jgi:hypothetical protein